MEQFFTSVLESLTTKLASGEITLNVEPAVNMIGALLGVARELAQHMQTTVHESERHLVTDLIHCLADAEQTSMELERIYDRS
jgi:hypothetical protein